MATSYWIFEYIKLFLGYGALMYLWPHVVFSKHLRGKGLTYRFAFCVTVQPLVVSFVVLGLGLLHILNGWTANLLLYGIPVGAALRRLNIRDKNMDPVRRFSQGAMGAKHMALRLAAKTRGKFRRYRAALLEAHGRRLREYALLAVLLAYGMLYFSWGTFQSYCYGSGDQYVHSQWVYSLSQGQIFSAGVYPEAMHCLIYAISNMFGIRQYTVILMLQNVHLGATLVAAYCLLREVFRWKYTPFFTLLFFLTMQVSTINEVYALSRLQWTLPQEFGGPAQFLCVLFLLRYLKYSKTQDFHWKSLLQLHKNGDLLMFALALASSVAIHFYVTAIAFFLCVPVALCHIRRLFTKERFLSLAAAVLCGVFAALLPMGLGLAEGIPLQASMGWAMNVLNGQDAESLAQRDPNFVQDAGGEGAAGPAQLLAAVRRKAELLYQYGYKELYPGGADVFVGFTVASAAGIGLWVLFFPLFRGKAKERIQDGGLSRNSFRDHLIFLLASVIFMIFYAAPYLGIPELIARVRLCSTEHLLLIAVCMILFDLLFSLWACWGEQAALKTVSALCGVGVWLAAIRLGYYHDYLYGEFSRYNGAVMATESAIQTLPKGTYTIVSPTEELYHMIGSGWHEELLDFVQKVQEEEDYIIPTQSVFLFIEKKPLRYGQRHFYTGPAWLAANGSEINESCGDRYLVSEITEEILERVDVTEFERGESAAYVSLRSRTAVESAADQWRRRFAELYPNELKVYYEDEGFVCYYFQQEVSMPYQLNIFS